MKDDKKAQLFDLLFRKGLRDTVEIAEYLRMTRDACRRALDKLNLLGEIERWDGTGMSSNNAYLWSLPDQREPLDPMTRLKEGYHVPRVFRLTCQRLIDDGKTVQTYEVDVIVVPQASGAKPWLNDPISWQTKWRAYARGWGAGKPGYGDPRAAAMDLPNKSGVKASVRSVVEIKDIYA